MQIHFPILPAENISVRGSEPDTAATVFKGAIDHADRGRLGETLHHAVLDRTKSGSIGADPQGLPAVLEKENDAVAGQSRRIVHVEGCEGFAIKPRQSIKRPQPEVAVVRLRDGDDGVFRQMIVGVPDIHKVRSIRRRAPSKKQRQREANDVKLDSPFQSLRKEYALTAG